MTYTRPGPEPQIWHTVSSSAAASAMDSASASCPGRADRASTGMLSVTQGLADMTLLAASSTRI